ncbi:protein FIP2-like [Mercurialis annua]|uniref:protein FIP2-like n=1 Tax=Mercurialis annua TaxID=3986 RepID=UPI0024AFDC30|nr:protein FIP2-like [Mercurialis annua]
MISSSTSTSRRVPPPCWTHQETVALVEAYRDKWFSVNRGNLRSADWDAVAAAVAESSHVPADPPKSSLQCRHKIEKLRKRYRMEKKRCLDHPGRFFSSWDLFPLLDAMAIGSSPGSKRCRTKDDSKKFSSHSAIDEGFDNSDDDDDLDVDQNLIVRANKYGRIDDRAYFDGNIGSSGDLGGEFRMKNTAFDVNNSVSVAFRPKDFNNGNVVNGKLIRKSSPKFGSEVHCRTERRGQFGEHIAANNGLVSQLPPPPIFRQRNFCNTDGNSRFDGNNSRASNGYSGVRKNGTDNVNAKEVADPFAELVSAIRLSTDNFVKVEKMKMEMAMEMEKVRMETMLTHNQMILESQQQIVNVFAKTILEKKEKRRKRKEMEVVLPCQDKNGEIQVAAADSESIGRSGIAKDEREGGSGES